MKAVLAVVVGLVLLAAIAILVMDPWASAADKGVTQVPYIVELDTPGGPLPFEMLVVNDPDHGDWISISNGSPEENLGSYCQHSGVVLERVDDEMRIAFPHFDSELRLRDAERPETFNGSWTKQRSASEAVLGANAFPDTSGRFAPIDDSNEPAAFSGRWSVDFADSDDLAIGAFEVDDNQIATGTFLTTTGDYRYLAGRVDGGLMRLSTFDGAHAFLFHARMQPDGSIEGDFWSGNWWHETWTAVRDDDARLPDAFEETSVTDAEALDELVFKNLAGQPTRVADLLDATGAKARVLEIFGTWCPNCADAGAELKRLKGIFGDDLGIVALAFEITEDHDRSATQVQRYMDRFGADWEVLIAGLSDKSKASEELPILDRVRSYPTTIFLDSDNQIVAVHTGFSGPATGEVHQQQQAEFERIIGELLED